jgi:hypothetical protein
MVPSVGALQEAVVQVAAVNGTAAVATSAAADEKLNELDDLRVVVKGVLHLVLVRVVAATSSLSPNSSNHILVL